jgi:anaerobic magnesium-protoporphyrin IX monomethyl ester cyclase
MTEVLLAHAFFLRNDPKQVEKMRPYPPLGTLYAAANLRERGYSVGLFDAMLSDGPEEFLALLERHRPRYVVLLEDHFNFLLKMCLGRVREAAYRMAEAASAAGAVVVAAGADVTDHPDGYLDHEVSFALTGEPDRRLEELLGALTGRAPRPLETIGGLVWRPHGGGPSLRNAPGEPERRLDAFPPPAWDLVDMERYRSAWMSAHGYFSLNMVTTRGCPFHCNWCAKPIWGQRYAIRSTALVAEEMALLKRNHRPDHVWFADDIFGLQPKWVAEFAREVESRDASIPFMIQSRADLMTAAAVEALARAGCVEVWLGAESGSQRVLDAMDKGIEVAEVYAARERLAAANIRACFFLQFGFPGETLEDIQATVEMVRRARPDDIGVSVSYPLPGTKFHAMVLAELAGKDHWDDSGDLAMMFRGTYETAFYRRLHRLIHRDLDLRRLLLGGTAPAAGRDLAEALDELNRDWFELGRMEARCRDPNPTPIRKHYEPAAAPDLSRPWN